MLWKPQHRKKELKNISYKKEQTQDYRKVIFKQKEAVNAQWNDPQENQAQNPTDIAFILWCYK